MKSSGASSDPAPKPDRSWSLINPNFLVRWAWRQADVAEALAVLEWVHDELLRNPDTGRIVSKHGRATRVDGTAVELIWVMYPGVRAIDLLAINGETDNQPG